MTLSDAAGQIRSHHAVAVLGAGLSASQYPMTANLAPLVWMALDADPLTRAKVAAQVGSSDTKAKSIVGNEGSALATAWREIEASKARWVFQKAFVDLDLEREPTAAHFALARLIRAQVLKYVISYNWDTALERAYEQLYGVPIPLDILVKPHGDANHPDIPWVLPHEDGIVPSPVKEHLAQMASSHPRAFMIVGYSGADQLVVRELVEPYEESWPVVRIGPSFTGPETVTGTADEVLPKLVTELQLDSGLRHWRNVTFFRQRGRYFQDLWMSEFQATSDPAVSVSAFDVSGVMSTGRSSSLPLWNTAPARTRATRCGALTARQRVCAASISL
jgi:hypothetical protein